MDLWKCVEANASWCDLSIELRNQLNNDSELYGKHILLLSLHNQLLYNGSVSMVVRQEKRYYEKLIEYGRNHYLLYPYHLQDKVTRMSEITPFFYYLRMLVDLIMGEKSYDCIPSFTAVDCLRLLGIGRNEYLDLVNTYKSFLVSTEFEECDHEKILYGLLPTEPVESISFEPWYIVYDSCFLVDDVSFTESEKIVLNKLTKVANCSIKSESEFLANGLLVADIDNIVLRSLYRRGFIYLDVPIDINDRIYIPTLKGFIMNRTSGDIREKLLYKLFVTADRNTTVGELADCLQVSVNLVKEAVSLFCRLGFAYKINRVFKNSLTEQTFLLDEPKEEKVVQSNSLKIKKKLALIFDSTVTAYLMMGNVSTDLKSHAVTMFEVGKLSEDSLTAFIIELDRLVYVNEGELKAYHEHVVNLRETVRFLRQQTLVDGCNFEDVDLIRSGSLLNLELETRNRVLNKNYSMVVSLISLRYEDQNIIDARWPVHLGPPSSVATSPWFSLYVSCVASGALKKTPNQTTKTDVLPVMLLPCGSRLNYLPNYFFGVSQFCLTSWNDEPQVVTATHFLPKLNKMLLSSPVFVQCTKLYDSDLKFVRCYITLPLSKQFMNHPNKRVPQFLSNLSEYFDLTIIVGYIIVLTVPNQNFSNYGENEFVLNENDLLEIDENENYLLFISLHLGLPIFHSVLNRAVCDRIEKSHLLQNQHHSKQILDDFNQRLVSQLDEFIFQKCFALSLSKCDQCLSVLAIDIDGFSLKNWPLPTRSFVCANEHFGQI